MNYENLTCAHCGKPMHDGEDIVVCPVCATPQHRECWMQTGHCANDSLHASGYVWKRENPVYENKTETDSASSNSKVCHICGSENPNDSLHCGNCGALFGENKSENRNPVCVHCGTHNDSDARHCKNCGAPLLAQGEFFNTNPYMGKSEFKEDDIIAGEKAGDLAMFIQASSHRYLRKFKRFADGKKLSINFAAFFFAPYWFFYRKLYKAGAFFVVFFAAVSMMVSGISAEVAVVANEYLEKYEAFNYETATAEEIAAFQSDFEKDTEEFSKKIRKPVLILAAVNLGMSLIAALVADRLYYKKVLEDMKLISENVKIDNMRKLMIARKGGLSPLAFAASVFGYNTLVNLMVYAADFITNSF